MRTTNAPFLTVNNLLAAAKLHGVDRIASVTTSPLTGQVGIVILMIGEKARAEIGKIVAGAVCVHGKSKPRHILESAGDARIALYLQWLEETEQNWGWSDLTMRYDFLSVSIACFIGTEMTEYVANRTNLENVLME